MKMQLIMKILVKIFLLILIIQLEISSLTLRNENSSFLERSKKKGNYMRKNHFNFIIFLTKIFLKIFCLRFAKFIFTKKFKNIEFLKEIHLLKIIIGNFF